MWDWLKRFLPAPRHYTPAPALSEAQICKALAVEIEGAPVFEAVLELINALENECDKAAADLVANHGVCASEVGGAEKLRELRDKMLELREQGRRDD